jgi:hypothetical protein
MVEAKQDTMGHEARDIGSLLNLSLNLCIQIPHKTGKGLASKIPGLQNIEKFRVMICTCHTDLVPRGLLQRMNSTNYTTIIYNRLNARIGGLFHTDTDLTLFVWLPDFGSPLFPRSPAMHRPCLFLSRYLPVYAREVPCPARRRSHVRRLYAWTMQDPAPHGILQHYDVIFCKSRAPTSHYLCAWHHSWIGGDCDCLSYRSILISSCKAMPKKCCVYYI